MKSKCKDINKCKQIKELNNRIKELEDKNYLLEYEIKELRTKYFSSSKRRKESGSNEGEIKEKKKRGAPAGHAGWYRKKPKKIDEIIEVEVEECPLCRGSNLRECPSKVEEHIQEDIILPKVKATLFIHHYKYCKDCKKVVSSGAGKDELINSYIGPMAKALAVYMKYEIKVSDRDIQEIFKKLFNLEIVASSVPGFRNQFMRKGIGTYKYLMEEIKKSAYVNIDETGWRQDGENCWLWNASNDSICINHIDKSRGQKVVEKLLGENYKGIIISDFLSAYNKIKANAKQKCLVHLLRDIKKAIECYPTNEVIQSYCKRLKELLQRAIQLKEEYYQDKKYSHNEYIKKCKHIENALDDFDFPDPQKGILLKLSKRLKKYKKELLTFLYYEDIPYHNNHAEQMIRPSVLLRKIIFGSRSPNGSINHNVSMSLIQTGKINGHDELKLLKYIFVTNQKDKIVKHIFPP